MPKADGTAESRRKIQAALCGAGCKRQMQHPKKGERYGDSDLSAYFCGADGRAQILRMLFQQSAAGDIRADHQADVKKEGRNKDVQ